MKSLVIIGLSIILNIPFPCAVVAGTRRCQGYENTSFCIDEKGNRTDCQRYVGGTLVCKGKNGYRKECYKYADSMSVCNDNRGVKVTCKHFVDGSICENSKGYRTSCKDYDGGVNGITICTDIDKKGNPI